MAQSIVVLVAALHVANVIVAVETIQTPNQAPGGGGISVRYL